MCFLQSRYWLPSLMVPIFLLGFVKAEVHWSDCTRDAGRVCFPYPMYLPYEARQALDLHWPAMLPVALLNQLPDSIDQGTHQPARRQWPRYLITISAVIATWYVVGLWWERLVSGRGLSVERKGLRYSLALFAGLSTLFSALVVYSGVRGGFEGPTMTDAGAVLPAILFVMALTECGFVKRFLPRQRLRLLIPALLMLLYVWSDLAWQAERSVYDSRAHSRVCSDQPGEVCFAWPFTPSPQIQDGLAVQLPPFLFAMLPSMVFPSQVPPESPAASGLRYSMVALYWFTIVSLAQREWPATTGIYRAARPWLVVICAVVSAFAFLGWLVGGWQHGPTPALAVAVGTGAVIYSIRFSRIRE